MDQFGMMEEEVEHVELSIPTNAIALTDDRGVFKVILKQGVGKDKPSKGSKVTVHYVGKLQNGEKFDSSYDHGQHFHFNVGRSEVIKAWDLCVASMLKGEKCRLLCSPKYGYGSRGSPPKILGNSVLEFEIELFDWEGEDLSPEGDKSIMREMIVEGEDFTMPNEGAEVKVSVVGKVKRREFYNKTLSYNVGEADPEMNIVPAIDIALKRMKRGEKSRLLVKSKYGFKATGNEQLKVPPNADLEYEVTLNEFVKAKESWEMTDDERIKQSVVVKEAGNAHLKAGKVAKAVFQYKKILDYLEYHDAKEDGSEAERKILEDSKKLKLAGSLNLALCYNKLKKHKDAIDMCLQALELNPTNEKGLYRAGEGCYEQREYEEAKNYFKKVVNLYPNNQQARSYLEKCGEKLKEKDKADMARYQGMFDKFTKEDKENEIRKKVSLQKEKEKAKAARQEVKSDGPPNEGKS